MSLFKIKCPNCGNMNEKSAKFCSHCGQSLESKSSVSTCPSCGSPVPNGANFCTHCRAKLTDVPTYERSSDVSREIGKDGIWRRRPDDFAQRIEVEDLRGIFRKEITVFQGTRALLIQGGVYKGTLDAGVYDLKYAQRWFTSNLDLRATVILVDSGDLSIRFSIPSIAAKDSFTVNANGQMVIRINEPLLFLENFLKSEYHVSISDIENRIAEEVGFVVRNIVYQFNSMELYGNREFSKKLEDELTKTLGNSLGRKGLQIISLSNVGISAGDDLSDILSQNKGAATDIAKARIEYNKNTITGNLATSGKINDIDNKFAVAAAAQGNRHIYEGKEIDNSINTSKKIHAAKLEMEDDEFEHDLKEMKELHEFQTQRKYDNLGVKERDLEIVRENERKVLENRSNASPEALISVLGGDNPAIKEIAKLELAKRGISLTAEQILAIQAGDSQAAADALKAMNNAKEQKEFNLRTEQMYKENADRMERIVETSLKAMGSTATAKATEQKATVVAGNGQSVFVNHESGLKCHNCGARITEEDDFCPNCGNKL